MDGVFRHVIMISKCKDYMRRFSVEPRNPNTVSLCAKYSQSRSNASVAHLVVSYSAESPQQTYKYSNNYSEDLLDIVSKGLLTLIQPVCRYKAAKVVTIKHAVLQWQHKLTFTFTTDTLYLARKLQLWGLYCKDFKRNLPGLLRLRSVSYIDVHYSNLLSYNKCK